MPGQRRLDEARRDADDTDTSTAELQRSATRDHVNAGLCRTVRHLSFAWLAPVHRGDIDNHAWASLLEHLPGRVLHAVENPAQSDGLDGFPFLAGELDKGRNAPKPAQLTTISSEPNAA